MTEETPEVRSDERRKKRKRIKRRKRRKREEIQQVEEREEGKEREESRYIGISEIIGHLSITKNHQKKLIIKKYRYLKMHQI